MLGNVAFANKKAEEKNTPSAVSFNSISGTITDRLSGEELAGVCVKIAGTELKTYTDFDGNYHFKEIKEGDYQLEIDFISYQKIKTPAIKVNGNESHQLNFKIKQLN